MEYSRGLPALISFIQQEVNLHHKEELNWEYIGKDPLEFSDSPVVRALCSTADGMGLIPGQGIKIVQTASCWLIKKKEKYTSPECVCPVAPSHWVSQVDYEKQRRGVCVCVCVCVVKERLPGKFKILNWLFIKLTF